MKKIITIGIIVLSIIVFFVFHDLKYSIILLLLYLGFIYYMNNKKQKEIKKEKEDKEYEFANLVSYLLIFLENNFNVYQALLTTSYCNDSLSSDIEKLIEEIDYDKSIVPYQNFAQKFETNIIYQLVMMIYQLDINGYDVKYLHNFPLLIENIRQAKIENMIAIRKTNMSYLTVLPIISLLVVVFTLSLLILTMMGGII